MSHPGPSVQLRSLDTGDRLWTTPERLIVAGYTGRDEAAVAEHIAELAAIGVPPPATVPAFYDLDPSLLTTASMIEVAGDSTSGEVEPVVIRQDGHYFLGVGSDHTDRALETVDIAESKAACPKVLGPSVADIGPDLSALDWDGVTLESVVDSELYQRGQAGTLRHPVDLVARMTEVIGDVSGDWVLFCGTVPLLNAKFVHGTSWRLRLQPRGGSALTHGYETTPSTS